MKIVTILSLILSILFAIKSNAAIDCRTLLEKVTAMLSPSRKEPEINLKKVVGVDGVTFHDEAAYQMLPRGSALLTSSGDLKQSGITAIIHAATGSAEQSGGYFEPTLESIRNSVANSVWLAERNGHKRIAIPLIGGGIFLSRLGIEVPALAKEIVTAAVQARTSIELRFVAFESQVAAFETAVQEYRAQLPEGAIAVVEGSLLNGSVHGATAIVNAANTEVRFGSGLSGAIAKATHSSYEIDQEARGIIAKFNQSLEAKN